MRHCKEGRVRGILGVLLTLSILVFFALGCSFDDAALKERTCESDTDCDIPKRCVDKLCQYECATSDDCEGIGAVCLANVCKIHDCSNSNPCINGDCIDSLSGMTCSCLTEYTGTYCDRCNGGYHDDGNGNCIEDGLCPHPDLCGDHGSCVSGDPNFVCDCDEGYAGDYCGNCSAGYYKVNDECVPVEECSPDFCLEHGTCVDDTGVAVCSCENGYTGNQCEGCADNFHREAEVCLPNETCPFPDPCGEFGDCHDDTGVITCSCQEGYEGEFCTDCEAGYHLVGNRCEVDESCENTTCSNHGECSEFEGELNCDCMTGYSGERCEVCDEGYHEIEGGDCEEDVNCPIADPCLPGGTCFDINGRAECECNEGYEGELCDDCEMGYHENNGTCVIDEGCQETSCSEHGTCSIIMGLISCACTAGYAGERCELCDEDGGYTLNSVSGLCEIPCEEQNYITCDGICVDGVGNDNCGGCGIVCDGNYACEYGTCECPVNYAGDHCDVCDNGYYGTNCSACPGGSYIPCNGSGFCDEGMLGTGVCTCLDEYHGNACEFSCRDNIQNGDEEGIDCGGSCLASCMPIMESCKAFFDGGHSTGNGLYRIGPNEEESFEVYCDMDNGGWTLVASVIEKSEFWNNTTYEPSTGVRSRSLGTPGLDFNYMMHLAKWRHLLALSGSESWIRVNVRENNSDNDVVLGYLKGVQMEENGALIDPSDAYWGPEITPITNAIGACIVQRNSNFSGQINWLTFDNSDDICQGKPFLGWWPDNCGGMPPLGSASFWAADEGTFAHACSLQGTYRCGQDQMNKPEDGETPTWCQYKRKWYWIQ